MALEKVQTVTVWVSDLEQALEFYVDSLGLQKRMDEEFGDGQRFVTVAAEGDTLQIALSTREVGRVGEFTGLIFGAADVEGTATELEGRGVEFTDPPVKQEWGATMATFRDPDGNRFLLHSQG